MFLSITLVFTRRAISPSCDYNTLETLCDAAKVVRKGRQLFIRRKEKHQVLLQAVLARIRMIEAVPI